jgi:hypothetical protein
MTLRGDGGKNMRKHDRHGFNAATRQLLAEMAGYMCSKPDCRALTIGASASTKPARVGVAAHIKAASPGGPRYDQRQNESGRRSYENGIWLCQTHSALVDSDAAGFTVETLQAWKRDAEKHAGTKVGRPMPALAASSSPPDQAWALKTLLDVAAIHHVRGVRSSLRSSTDDEYVINALNSLSRYLDDPMAHYSPEVFQEIQFTVSMVTNDARAGISREVVRGAMDLAHGTLPITSLVGRSHRHPSPSELELLSGACSIGFDLAYDAAKYLNDIVIVDAGAFVLWKVLRFAHLNTMDELKNQALDAFETAIHGAVDSPRGPFDDAVRWLTFKRDDAMALDNEALPTYPTEIANRIAADSA